MEDITDNGHVHVHVRFKLHNTYHIYVRVQYIAVIFNCSLFIAS